MSKEAESFYMSKPIRVCYQPDGQYARADQIIVLMQEYANQEVEKALNGLIEYYKNNFGKGFQYDVFNKTKDQFLKTNKEQTKH